jgi:hypothetical protein
VSIGCLGHLDPVKSYLLLSIFLFTTLVALNSIEVILKGISNMQNEPPP